MESSDSSADGKYSDGVYSVYSEQEKVQEGPSHTPSPSPREKPPKLPIITLACMVLLLICCFVGILVSGLQFSNKVAPGDCLGQSWAMFASVLGLLYISLHLQASRKGEPVNRQQPCSQNPLHSSVLVVARLDAVAWAIALIILAVAVSKDPVPVSCANLAACTAVTPAILIILCIDEKAANPFDLPYITTHASVSVVTCRLSALLPTMPDTEVSADDSISRRGSSSSRHSTGRPNSHTQHAAAIAASNSGGASPTGLSGPRPPPHATPAASSGTAREPRATWAGFQTFDDRTKRELAASVVEASQTSEARARVGGPRALALSDKARQTGVLPPPVCLAPKLAAAPPAPEDKENAAVTARAATRDVSGQSNTSSGKGGSNSSVASGWKKDWGVLAADTGYRSCGTSVATSAASTAAPPATTRAPVAPVPANRRLSPVREVVTPVEDNNRRRRLISSRAPHYVQPPPSQRATAPPRLQEDHYTHVPPVSAPVPAAAPPVVEAQAQVPARARMRLVRAQEALKVKGAKDTVVVLNRPARPTQDLRATVEDEPQEAPPASSRPRMLRIPGSYVEG